MAPPDFSAERSPPSDSHAPRSAADWRPLYPFASHLRLIDNYRYHYLDEGPRDAEVLLCVHGNPTWSFYWRNVAWRFRDRYRVVVPDHLGCGLSGKPQDYPYTLSRHVDNLRTLLREMDLRRITLIAHDWGGAIGLGAAVADPERFSRLVLTNTGAFRDRNIPRRIAVCRTPIFGSLTLQGLNGFSLAALKMATNRPDGLPPAVQAGLIAPYDSWENRLAVLRFVQDIPLEPSAPSFAKITEIETQLASLRPLPTQLIWGMKDWCFSPHFLHRFRTEFFPDARVKELPDAGHYVLEDDPEAVLGTIETFLNETSLPSPLPAFPTQPPPVPTPKPRAVKGLHETVNVAARLAETARRDPNGKAVIFPQAARDQYGRRKYAVVTFRELDRESDRLARGLKLLGVVPGTRLALMVRPGREFVALAFAMFKAGAVAILIDPGMGRTHLLKCLAEAEPEGFVAIPPVQAVRSLLRRRFPAAKFNVTVGRRQGWLWDGSTYEELLGGEWVRPELAPTKASDPAAIIFTTGSTGPPKGVLYRHGNFDAQVDELRDRYGIRPGEVNLPGFPLFTLFDAAMGVTTVVPDMDPTRPARVDPAKFVEAIHDHGVTQAFGSPAIWNRVGAWCDRYRLKLPTLKRVLSAGAPVPPRVLATLRRCLPTDAEIHTPYGATEALPVASIESRAVLEETSPHSNRGAGTCVGTAFPGIAWKIVRITDQPLASLAEAEELPPGEIGELIVSGPVVTTEYFRRPDATALAKIPDGPRFWHRMGDAGYLDAQGRFWFCGRLAHRVPTADGPRCSVPCEGIFNVHPRVFRSALVGVPLAAGSGANPSGKAGDSAAPGSLPLEPVIVIEPLPGEWPRDAADRRRFEAELLARGAEFPLTSNIRRVLFHPAFPVDIRHNAKIFRERLALWAAGILRR